jgi:hypothetical protein
MDRKYLLEKRNANSSELEVQLVDTISMNLRFDFWEWLWLSDIRNKQDRTNSLLEQIRYNGLTPAQRGAEDAAARAEDARANRDTFLALGIGFSIMLLIGILFLIGMIPHAITTNASGSETAERQARDQREVVWRESLATSFRTQGLHLYQVVFTIVNKDENYQSQNFTDFVVAANPTEAWQRKTYAFAAHRKPGAAEHDTILISSTRELPENEALDECIGYLRRGAPGGDWDSVIGLSK